MPYGFNDRDVAVTLKGMAANPKFAPGLSSHGRDIGGVPPNLLSYPMELVTTLPAAVVGPPFTLGTSTAYILNHNDDNELVQWLPNGTDPQAREVYNMFTSEITTDKLVYCMESWQGKLYVVAVLC